MTLQKILFTAILVTVLLTSAGRYHIQQGRTQEAARLRSENDQLRRKASQQYQSQQLQTSTSEQKAGSNLISDGPRSEASTANLSGQTAVEVPSARGTEYRNDGQATPVAALQTLAWACDHGDSALMLKLVVFDADAREKTAAHFASLPVEERPQGVSFEAMAADLYVSDGMKHPYPVAEVLQLAKFESINPGRVRLHLPGANGDGYEFQQTAEGWKLAVTVKVVDDYIKESAELAAKP